MAAEMSLPDYPLAPGGDEVATDGLAMGRAPQMAAKRFAWASMRRVHGADGKPLQRTRTAGRASVCSRETCLPPPSRLCSAVDRTGSNRDMCQRRSYRCGDGCPKVLAEAGDHPDMQDPWCVFGHRRAIFSIGMAVGP